jgi:hypothetical protein
MRGSAIAAWALSLSAGLRLSRAKTLAALTAAAARVGRATLANLGRHLAGLAACKHRIKRAWRFCANDRVAVSDAMAGLIERLCRRRRKPLPVALDWTEVRNFHPLMAAAVGRGRALPLLWASYPEWRFHRSQNALEEGLLVLLRTLIPERVPVILLADRGFGRADLVPVLRRLGFRFLIRVKSDVWVEHPRYRGRLYDYPVKRGMWRVLRGARYRKEDPVELDLVIRWKAGLPAKRDEPWFLITDLPGSAVRLTDLYAKRMTVEELFRDGKSWRSGYGLRGTQVTRAERFDRLLLVLALAYWVLTGLGLLALARLRPGAWCSSNDAGPCSAFTIGRVLRHRLRAAAGAAIAAAVRATISVAPKLGTT